MFDILLFSANILAYANFLTVVTMPPDEFDQLSRRERQIMDILYKEQECSAHEVLEKLPDPPSYSSIRALIARLVEKNLVKFRIEGKKHIYAPIIGEKKAQSSAIKKLLSTFFKGSRVEAVTALLDADSKSLTPHEIEALERTIQRIKNNK